VREVPRPGWYLIASEGSPNAARPRACHWRTRRVPGVREPDASFHLHWHEEWSLGAITAGTCAFSCAGRRQQARAGDVAIIPPYAVHTAHTSGGAFAMDGRALHRTAVVGVQHPANDNPYSESLFRTMKYVPEYPRDGFASVDAARAWVASFVTWYNDLHAVLNEALPCGDHQACFITS